MINNAGIVFHPYEKTDEGFEIHFVTNYLGKIKNNICINININIVQYYCAFVEELILFLFIFRTFFVNSIAFTKIKSCKTGKNY